MNTEMNQPSTEACTDLLRSLQQLVRARRRSTRVQDAGALMMLSALEGTPGARVSALAELLMIDISAASRQVSALEAAGLVGRVTDSADHRAQLVRLTPSGSSALAMAGERSGSDLAGRISNWSEADVRLLAGLLQSLTTDLIASEPGCAKTHPAAAISRQPVGAAH